MRILYVEDNPDDARLLTRYFQTTGHDLALVTTVDDARAAYAGGPDMILLDVLLGNARAGYGLAREWRGDGFDGPMIAVTALSTPPDRQACLDAGFDSILNKPFTIDQLAEVISQYLD